MMDMVSFCGAVDTYTHLVDYRYRYRRELRLLTLSGTADSFNTRWKQEQELECAVQQENAAWQGQTGQSIFCK